MGRLSGEAELAAEVGVWGIGERTETLNLRAAFIA